MSGFSHSMVRRSDRNPRAEAVGDNGPSNGQNSPPPLSLNWSPPQPVQPPPRSRLSQRMNRWSKSQHLHHQLAGPRRMVGIGRGRGPLPATRSIRGGTGLVNT